MNPMDENAVISKLSRRISDSIDFLISIFYVKREVVQGLTTVSWRGIAGISDSLQSLTPEEEELQRTGDLVWKDIADHIKSRMERYKKNCESLEEAIKKEEIYVGSCHLMIIGVGFNSPE